jgi:hypothetical protein
VPASEYLRFRLDDAEAQYLDQQPPTPRRSRWQVVDPVSRAPKFSFELVDTVALGDIKTITLRFYPKWKGEYVSKAAPVIVSADPDNPEIQMQSGVEYDLAALGDNFKVTDARGGSAPHFALRPGFEYKIEVVFGAQQSHIAEIVIRTSE